MHPILIDLGFFALPSYGVLLAVAVLAALWTARIRADATGLDAARVVDFGLWLVIWALLGAKILLVVVEWKRYLGDPSQLLGLVRAGGVFLGGFIAAIIAAAVLLRRYRLEALPTFDVLAPSLALGQTIGRIGCLLAGCCWGHSCDLPWAITYTDPAAAANVGTPLHVAVHPFPAYAALFNFSVFLVLSWLYAKRLPAGRVFASYLVLYGVGRFFLELTRGDEARGVYFNGLLSTSQLIAAALVTIGVAMHWWIGRRGRA
ncbi:MAG: prolipoprotein diacylglyceryl transferase [Thermoanaerobaculales bacterium]|jgi:phosphatidylglycerol:prolipoprotein diacylglycerol transferase|nr:prolipoprotein diacylglyceryl transferase [Thermoanaerobaculales bacterium]